MKGSGQNCVLRLQWATSLFFSVGFAHPDPLWIPFKEVAVTLIYQMAEGPDVICAQILQGCAKQALEKLEEKSTPQDDPSKWQEGRWAQWAEANFCCFPCQTRSHCHHHFLQ